MSEAEATPAGHLVVRVGERRFRLELTQVEGVAIAPPVNPVPGTPPSLRGLVNHRGTILPAVDADPTAPGERRHVVLLASRGFGRFALLCDWVEDLAEGEAAADAESLDADALAEQVVAEYAATEQRLPEPSAPAARILLRRVVT